MLHINAATAPSSSYQTTRRHHGKNTHFILTLPSFTPPILTLLSRWPIVFKIHPRYSTELYTLVTHLCQQMSPLLPPISQQQMALPSLASPTRSLTPTSSSNETTPAPVSRRETGREDWAQLRPPSFLGERPLPKNTYGGWPFQSPPPPKNTYSGMAPFPIPHIHPTHRGSRGAIAYPPHTGSNGAIAHPPHCGATPTIPNLWLANPSQPMARQPTHGSRATHPPHRGICRSPTYGQHGYPTYGSQATHPPHRGICRSPTYGQHGYPSYGSQATHPPHRGICRSPTYGQHGYPTYGSRAHPYTRASADPLPRANTDTQPTAREPIYGSRATHPHPRGIYRSPT